MRRPMPASPHRSRRCKKGADDVVRICIRKTRHAERDKQRDRCACTAARASDRPPAAQATAAARTLDAPALYGRPLRSGLVSRQRSRPRGLVPRALVPRTLVPRTLVLCCAVIGRQALGQICATSRRASA